MSAEIINLRQARKRKAKEGNLNSIAANRIKFGQTKAEKGHEAANKRLETSKLDQLIRERPVTKDEC